MGGENDNPDSVEAPVFRASWLVLALPFLVIACGYGGLFVWLEMSGRSDGALARLCFYVLVLAVPLLAVHALLRALTIRVCVMGHAVFVHQGFPRGRAIELPYRLIRNVDVRRGLADRLVSSGTIVLTLVDGTRLSAPALIDFGRAAEIIRSRAEKLSRPDDAPAHIWDTSSRTATSR